jgi:hypothetical protein
VAHRSPLLTLAAVAVGIVVMLVVDSTQSTGGPSPYGAPSPAASTTPTVPPATTAPVPTKAPTTPVPPVPRIASVYAGRTAGHYATLAIAVAGGRAAAYLCDGHRVEAWFTGTVRGGRLQLASRQGARLTGTLDARRTSVTGIVTVGGRKVSYRITKAVAPAGLYRARARVRNAVTTIGWIVFGNGAQVGIAQDGTPAPAPRLDPVRRRAVLDGVTVTARRVSGYDTF